MAASRDAILPDLGRAPWLSRPATQAVLAALARGGFEARVVGGAVRNTLMGLPVTDVDIATTAHPPDVVTLAGRAGLKVVETGLRHGTVTVIADHVPFEVTTLRVDVDTDGRHATVAFTDDWAADAARRDFTMNALYADAAGRVFDPVGGYPDVLARRVRFIGDPVTRIREDYLRILRYFRFYSSYETARDADRDSLAACIAEQAGLDRISAERTRVELIKTMAGANVEAAVSELAASGVLTRVTGLAPRPAVLARLARIEAILEARPDAVLRLACLLVAVEEDAERLARRLRLSSAEREMMLDVARALSEPRPATERMQRARLYRLGAAGYRVATLAGWAAGPAAPDDPAARHAATLADRWTSPRLPLDGAALLARGVPSGPRLGRILKRVEAWWIESDFPADADRLEAELAAAIADT